MSPSQVLPLVAAGCPFVPSIATCLFRLGGASPPVLLCPVPSGAPLSACASALELLCTRPIYHWAPSAAVAPSRAEQHLRCTVQMHVAMILHLVKSCWIFSFSASRAIGPSAPQQRTAWNPGLVFDILEHRPLPTASAFF